MLEIEAIGEVRGVGGTRLKIVIIPPKGVQGFASENSITFIFQ